MRELKLTDEYTEPLLQVWNIGLPEGMSTIAANALAGTVDLPADRFVHAETDKPGVVKMGVVTRTTDETHNTISRQFQVEPGKSVRENVLGSVYKHPRH